MSLWVENYKYKLYFNSQKPRINLLLSVIVAEYCYSILKLISNINHSFIITQNPMIYIEN